MISGKGFADLATWIYDPRYRERPFLHWGSRTGDWVFINGDHLDQFLSIRLPVAKRFNIIIHNSDIPFDTARLTRTLPRALRIYAINTTVHHPQLTTIPLGFPDSGLKHLGMIAPQSVRDIEIYSNFSAGTNVSARAQCLKAFEGDSRVVRKEPVGRTQPEYYEDMCHAKFVLCPEGTGVDTHRIYEALACGATPVVLHGSLDHLYAKFPICIVNSWTDEFYVPSLTHVNFNPSWYCK
jgi:hypothetical protein